MLALRYLVLGISLVPLTCPLSAQEITLRGVSSFAEGSFFSRGFERFIEKVNHDGKGVIQINYIGGPRAVPPFEVGNALRTRVVDIANATGAFYTNLMPEADALKLFDKSPAEQRKNGTWAYLNELHNKKMNAYYLARQFYPLSFHIYLNKPIDKFDFSGLKIRVTPIYRDLVQVLGGTPITTAPGEVYTALERGVVDGYGWPLVGIFDFGWERATKYRLEPPFYSVEGSVLVNLDTWKSLTDAQRKILFNAAEWIEGLGSEHEELMKSEQLRQEKAGIQALKLGAEASREFLKRANEVAWQAVINKAPDTGKKLRELAGD